MDTTTLGRTGLRVSVAGLGCGGFSRLGTATGKTLAESIAVVRTAIDCGVNLIDTAANYKTEGVVGQAIAGLRRDALVITTKASIHTGEATPRPVPEIIASLENSLRELQTPYIDVFQLHGIPTALYEYAEQTILPALKKQQEKGKIRFIGFTEPAIEDITHQTLALGLKSDAWDTVMIAFNMMHQNARETVFPLTQQHNIGTLLMFVVRNIFASADRLAPVVRDLVADGQLPAELAKSENPLDFLIHEGGASSLTDAAYRFARYEPGVDVVLFGTGNAAHVHDNVASLLKPPLPPADHRKLVTLLGHLLGVGIAGNPNRQAERDARRKAAT